MLLFCFNFVSLLVYNIVVGGCCRWLFCGDIYLFLKCINEINDILCVINVWCISCLSEKYLESRL